MASLADLLAYSQNLAKKYTSLDTPQDQTLGETLGDVALGFAPVVGTAQGARDFERARRENDWLGMGLSAASMIPVAGGVVKAGRTATKASKIAEILNEIPSKNLETVFHGSTQEIENLDPKKSFGRLGVSWVTPKQDFAQNYTYGTGNVYKMDLDKGKNFDFSNVEDLAKLKAKAKDVQFYDPLRGKTTLDKFVPENSDYFGAEHPLLFNLIKKMGYDTVTVTENGVKNIGVFNPKKSIMNMKKVDK